MQRWADPAPAEERRFSHSARLAIALGVVALSGCSEVEAESETGYEPSKLAESYIEFTPEGAKRTGLRTRAVARSGRRVSVPYAALLYDPEGRTYVYTSPEELRYVKKQVRVHRIGGDRVVLSRGPPAGTQVVTVGAVEVYGTELEVPAK
jgi:hypothetical protein